MAVEEIKNRKRIADMMKLEISAMTRNLSIAAKLAIYDPYEVF
jgi:hypothetical protein